MSENLTNKTKSDLIKHINRQKGSLSLKDNRITVLEKELSNKLHKSFLAKIHTWIENHKNNILDIFILFFFILSIAFTSLFTLYNVYHSIEEYLSESQSEIGLLTFIEHFFLYIIPIFVLIGFYVYYIIKYRPIIIGENDISKEKIKSAENSIQLTKTLFISSIMSYTIIKIIEKIFVLDKDACFDEYSILQLISYGVFLLMLMIYLIFTHKSND